MSEFDFINSGSGSYDEQPQQYVNIAPQMESYDYNSDTSDLPYVPSTGVRYQQPKQPVNRSPINKAFIDINDPASFQNNNKPNYNNQNNSASQYQQNLQQYSVKPEPGQGNIDIDGLRKNANLFQDLEKNTKSDDSEVASYAIGAAIKAVSDAITALENPEYWLPSSHTKYADTLKKIGNPIIAQGLRPYLDKISKLR